MDDLSTILSIAVALLALASLIAVGWVVVRTKLAQTTIELQDKEINALKQRLGTVETEKTALEVKVEAQSQEIKVLERAVRHESEIQHLITSLAEHREADRVHHEVTEKAITKHHSASEEAWRRISETLLRALGGEGEKAIGHG